MINNHNEAGRTMLEMLGVLGIMGVLMFGAIAGINYGMTTYKINQTYNEVKEVVQGVVDLYSWTRGYPNNNFTDVVCKNDVFSLPCISNHGRHQFAGNIDIIGTDCSGTVCDSFKVVYSGMKASDCYRLSDMEWGNIQLIGTGDGGECASGDNQDITFQLKDD